MITTTISTVPGAQQADGVDHPRTHHPAPLGRSVSVRSSRVQCRTMPIWLSVNADEHPDDVELDQRGHLGAERDDERDGGEREEQDAVGERQPVATGVQLAGQVSVLGQDGSRARESR